MHRIDTPNRAINLWGAGKDGWRDGNKAAGINPTEFNAAFQNMTQEELAGIVEAAGLALDPANNGQVLLAIEKLIEARSGNYALDTGAANAYVVALSPAVAAYTDGLSVRVKIVNANSGAATLNAGGGAVALVNDVGSALVTGDLPAGGIFSATYVSASNSFLINSLVQSQAMSQTAADARYSALASTAASDPTFANNSSNPASTSWVRGAMSAIAIAAGFAASIAANGYVKFPTWLGVWVIQWGGITQTSLPTGLTVVAVTYPVTFPNNVYVTIPAATGGGYSFYAGCQSGTTSGFSLNLTNNAGAPTSIGAFWIAIGK